MDSVKLYIGSEFAGSTEWMSLLKENVKGLNVDLFSENTQIKEECDFILYVFTPNSDGVSTIINAVNDSNHLKEKTIFCVLSEVFDEKFTSHQEKSLIAAGKMIELNGGNWFKNMDEVLEFIVRTK
jgi:hypothetical protein